MREQIEVLRSIPRLMSVENRSCLDRQVNTFYSNGVKNNSEISKVEELSLNKIKYRRGSGYLGEKGMNEDEW